MFSWNLVFALELLRVEFTWDLVLALKTAE